MFKKFIKTLTLFGFKLKGSRDSNQEEEKYGSKMKERATKLTAGDSGGSGESTPQHFAA